MMPEFYSHKQISKTLFFKSFFLPLFILFLQFQSVSAQTVTQVVIGNVAGTSNWFYGPIYRNTGNAGTINYSKYAYLYTSSELGIPAGSKIIKLEWMKKDTGKIFANNNFSVWISNTAATTLASPTQWSTLTNGSINVFNSTTYAITGTSNTYIAAPFTDSFVYGGGSLQILTDWSKLGYATAAVPFYTSAAVGKAIGIASATALTNASNLQSGSYGNNRPTLRITYVTVPTCLGTPNPGNTISSVANICPGVQFNLSVQNTTNGSQVSYQWQSADDINFTTGLQNLATNSTQIQTQTSNKYYRCIVTCGASSASGTSTPVYVPMSPVYGCYCVSTALSSADEDIVKFTLGTVKNCSDCSSLASGAGSVTNLYSNYQNLTSASAEKGAIVPFSIEVGICGSGNYPNRSAIFIDYNQNSSFADPGELVYSSPSSTNGAHTETGSILIPTSALTGATGIRVICSEQAAAITNPCLQYSWGETEDYVINITPGSACNGMPSAGNTILDLISSCSSVSGTYSLCSGMTANLSLSNTISGTGISYQWYDNSGPISGATSPAYTTYAITSPRNFYCNVTCINSGLTASSVPISLTLSSFLNCYCSSGASLSSDEEILSFSLNNTTNVSDCLTPATGIGSVLNQYSNFTPLGNLTTVQLGATIPFSLYVDDCDVPPPPYYTFGTSIWIDFNHNASFDDAGEQVFLEPSAYLSPRTVAGNIDIPCNAMTGQTRMRITIAEGVAGSVLIPCLQYGFGETEDYFINIEDAPRKHSLTYNLGDITASSAPVLSTPTGNFTVSNLSSGNNANTAQSGLLMTNTSPSNYAGASTNMNAAITARNRNFQASDSSAYFQFILTGNVITLDSLKFGTRSTSTGPTKLEIRTSKDNYATSIGNVTVAANSSWTYVQPTLTPVSSIVPLTVRIYGYVPGGAGTVTTGDTTVNWRIDDIRPSVSMTCTIPCVLGMTVSATPITCFGGKSTITATVTNPVGVVTYQLNGGTSQSSNVFTNLSAGTYTVKATDPSSCALSTVVTITQPNLVSTNISASACNTYNWSVTNQTYTTSGVYTSTGTTASGCTKYDTLNLNIISSTTSNITTSACGSYTWALNATTYTSSGIYTYVSGCVTTHLNLTIVPNTTSSQTASACGSYTWSLNGVTYTTSGAYTYLAGCNTTTLNLNITPNTSSTVTASACNAYVWSLNGTTYTTSGNYTNVSGCVTTNLVLTIVPSTSSTVTASACGSYTWSLNGVTYTNSGTYSIVSGCNTTNLNLTIVPNTTSSQTASACGSYTWGLNGVTYTTSGAYTYVAGCNTTTLNLSITPNTSSTVTASACNSYFWALKGVTYTTSGTYTNVSGCLTTSLVLTIVPNTSSTVTASACGSYTWSLNSVTYTTSGTYSFVSGCNTTNLNLTIVPNTTSSQTASACGSYTWALNGATYTSSGTYTNVNGCNTTTLNLSITPNTSSTVTTSACNSYTWQLNGVTYTSSGTYTNVNGCVTTSLVLTIIPNTSSTITASACGSYTWSLNGVTYTTSGTYSFVSSCNTTNLNLTIVPNTTSSQTASACGSYTWSVNSVTYTSSGTYTNVNGCNTTTLNLSITPNTSSTVTASACNSYFWALKGVTYTASGTYTNVSGCVTTSLVLTIIPTSSSTVTTSACGSYTWPLNGVTYTNSGTYTNVNGCNTTNLNLTIVPNTTSTQTASACDSYTWTLNGVTYTNSGTYTVVNGCLTNQLVLTVTSSSPSTISATACGSYTWQLNSVTYTASGTYLFLTGCNPNTLVLTIIPNTSSSLTATACGSYTWATNNVTYTASGIYSVVAGCNTSNLNLTITPNTTSTTTVTACDSYHWSVNNITYTTSGNYISITGCNTSTLVLTVTPSTSSSSNVSACGSYTWLQNSVTYTSSGSYTHTVGCHTYILNLSVTPITTSTVNASACGSYTWAMNNVTYTTSGTYTNVNGCNTTTLNLTITPNTSSTQTASACNSYQWSTNNVTYITSGTYTSVNACHTSTLILTIIPNTTSSVTATACGSYHWNLNNVTYTASGDYTNVNVCETTTLHLTVTPNTTSTVNASACNSYTWSLNGVTYTTSGTYTNLSGCHTTSLVLSIIPSTTSTITASACGSYTWALNGITYTSSGTYSFVNGCSTTNINLTIVPNTTSTQTASSCNSYTWALNNVTYTTSGNYSYVNGCNTTNLNLTITTGSNSTSTTTACTSYTWGLNNVTYTNSGSYTYINGCNISTLNLTIKAVSSSTQNIIACDSYTWGLNSATYTASGVYSHTITHGNVFGCDSIVTLALTIHQSTTSTVSIVSATPYTWNLTGLTYSISGTYTKTSVNTTGCLHTSTLNLIISIPLSLDSITEYQPISCHGNNDGATQIYAHGNAPLTYSIDGGSFTNTDGLFFGLTPGTHTTCVKDASNNIVCGTITFIEPDPLVIHLTTESMISCAGNDGVLFACISGGSNVIQGYLTWWTNAAGDTVSYPYDVMNNGNFDLYLDSLSAGVYTLMVEDDRGCFADTSASVMIANSIQPIVTFAPLQCNSVSTLLNITGTGGWLSKDPNYVCDPILAPDYFSTLTYKVNGVAYDSTLQYSAGTYTIVATDAMGCTGSTVVTISASTGGSNTTQSITTCGSYTWPTNGVTYTASGVYTFTSGCNISTLNLTITCSSILNLKVFIEGYYLNAGMMRYVLQNQGEGNNPLATDSITVTLYATSAPYAAVTNVKTVLNTNGTTTCSFGSISGSYFIGVDHRNGLNTWSATPVTIGATAANYDFTTANTQSYGSNMVEVETGVWAIYSGDISSDQNIDLNDMNLLEAESMNFSYGYNSADLNGDGNIDLMDFSLLESNMYLFIYSVHP